MNIMIAANKMFGIRQLVPRLSSLFAFRRNVLLNGFHRRIKQEKWIIEDDLSVTHAQLLYKTLNSLTNSPKVPKVFQKPNGLDQDVDCQLNVMLPNEKLPLGYQFVYFNSLNDELVLGSDGYDNHQAPTNSRKEALYKRRLWVGGKLVFNNENPLRFGQLATCLELVEKVKPVGDNAFVTIDRKFFNSTDMSTRESRTLIYTNEPFDLNKLSLTASITSCLEKYKSAQHTLDLSLTNYTLFRFSALTFNAHRIHYDLHYAQKVEKYPSLLVQGPFTVTLLLQWFQYLFPDVKVETFSYKNKFPLFANDRLIFKCNKINSLSYDIWLENSDHILCCDAKITAEECL